MIGAGQSGPSLAVRLAEAGRSVALIERRGLGGTCVNDGCIPTKTLVASARAAHVVRGARAFGVGGRRAWEQDVFIPRRHGIYQPVGDSVMPGGSSRACGSAGKACQLSVKIKTGIL